MSQDLSLAQNKAWNLARTLMTPVILFKANENEYGVLPTQDLDDDEVEAIFEYCPLLLERRPLSRRITA